MRQSLLFLVFLWIGGVVLGWFACRWLGVLDRPWLYSDVKRTYRIPMMQWVPLFLVSCLLLFALFWADIVSLPLVMLLWWWLIFVYMTVLDEYVQIHPLIRFALQALVSIVFVVRADIPFPLDSIWLTFDFHPFVLYWLSVVWILFCLNAINRIDGVSWLASGLSTIWLGTIVLLSVFVVIPLYPAMSPENLDLLTQTVIVASVVWGLAFLYTIMESAWRGLLRDPGTYFLAFTLAYVSLIWWAKIGTLVVALSLPLFDAIRVWINRLFVMKKSPTKWDYTHIHHRLMALWRSKWEIRTFVRWRSLMMMILVLMQWPNQFHKIIIFAMAAILFFGVNIYLYWVKKIPMEYGKMKEKG